MKHALVTGLHGFTGRYVRTELEQAGYEVFGLGAPVANRSDDHYVVADLTNTAQIAAAVDSIEPEVVIHLAAIAFVGHGNANAFYEVNLLGTRNLLAALAALPRTPRNVLIASSANIYGNATAGVLTEKTPANPANDYAVSKLAMEYATKLWNDRLPITVVRPFNYTGVGQSESFLLPKIVAHFKRKAPFIELGNLDVWRDFSDVRAVANAYRRLIEAPSAGLTFNVCSGTTHSLREVVSTVSSLTGHDIEIRVNPAFVRANEVKTLQGSADLLRSVIGEWNTPPLEETLSWMLSSG